MQKEQHWYYEANGYKRGPFSKSELEERFASQKLSLNTKVWNVQMPDWVEASKVDDFAQIAHTQPMQRSTFSFKKLKVANVGETAVADALSLHLFDTHTSNIATFRERAIALSIDLAILGVVASILLTLDLPIIGTLKRDTLFYSVPSLSFIFMLLGWIYFVFAEYLFQSSLGKRFMKLKIVNNIGGQPSFEQLTGRYFIKVFSILLFGIGCFLMLKSRKGKTLHDTVAETLVKSKNRK